jgi:type IV secretory pathway VirB10-like protein
LTATPNRGEIGQSLLKENIRMNNFIGRRALRLLAGGALVLAAGLAQAQYIWIDEKGMKQLSDRPPPPSVPDSKILKAPGKPPPPVIDDGSAPAPAAAKPAPAVKGPPTLAERNADFRKRAKEEAEKDQKAAADAQRKKERAENCDAARQNKAQLASGVRIRTTGANGEAGYLSDEERAARSVKANQALAGCE